MVMPGNHKEEEAARESDDHQDNKTAKDLDKQLGKDPKRMEKMVRAPSAPHVPALNVSGLLTIPCGSLSGLLHQPAHVILNHAKDVNKQLSNNRKRMESMGGHAAPMEAIPSPSPMIHHFHSQAKSSGQ